MAGGGFMKHAQDSNRMDRAHRKHRRDLYSKKNIRLNKRQNQEVVTENIEQENQVKGSTRLQFVFVLLFVLLCTLISVLLIFVF